MVYILGIYLVVNLFFLFAFVTGIKDDLETALIMKQPLPGLEIKFREFLIMLCVPLTFLAYPIARLCVSKVWDRVVIRFGERR